jgi:hypothetical protein
LIYYIDQETLDSNEVILKLVNELLKFKYRDILFYCQNLGAYDLYFILKVLIDYNNTQPEDNKFKFNYIFRNNLMIKLTIKRNNPNSKRPDSVTIADSYAILDRSLSTLCEMFKVKTHKGVFPHKFANNNTLFYIGNTPDINYYKDIDVKDYNELIKTEWNFKNECIIYLTKDLESLYQILYKFNHTLFVNFELSIRDSLTISKLALNILLKNFYDFAKNPIPLINDKDIYNNIRQSYFGGITEVYKPYGKNKSIQGIINSIITIT